MPHHQHHGCLHLTLGYCSQCDVVYCKACDREWGARRWLQPWTYSYPVGSLTGFGSTTANAPSSGINTTHEHS